MMKSIEARKTRWCEALMPTRPGRKFIYLVGYPMTGVPAYPKFWPDHKQERIEWAWQRYLCFKDRVTKVDDDVPRGIALADDEIGSVNPAMFEEFFRDELNALSDRYGGIGIHCCAHSEHQWANLAAVRNLRFRNLYQPQPVIDRAYRYFSPFAAHWHGALVNGVPGPLQNRPSDEYPDNCRAVLNFDAPDEDSARDLAAQLADKYRWD